MRVPGGTAAWLREEIPNDSILLGCLSPEPRSVVVPAFFHENPATLLRISDPPRAFPDHTLNASNLMDKNLAHLKKDEVEPVIVPADLLCGEDTMIDILRDLPNASTLILDITSLPKRFFCFFLKRLLRSNQYRNVAVTYTAAGGRGYAEKNLMGDFLEWDFLPGFSGNSLSKEDVLLILGVGFVPVEVARLADKFPLQNLSLKILLSYPSAPDAVKREMKTLHRIMEKYNPADLRQDHATLNPRDPELVAQTISSWKRSGQRQLMVPFGPKLQTLGMLLVAIRDGCGICYSQPRSYSPQYTTDHGQTQAFILKWEGIPCYARHMNP